MIRYSPEEVQEYGVRTITMVEDKDGDYCLYDEAIVKIKELENEIKDLKAINRYLSKR